MEPFRYHVFVCDQEKPEGLPSCPARGSGDVIQALNREIASQGLVDDVQVTTSGSLGLCEHGPNMVVYPEGVWYCGVTPQDVPEIVRSHFQEGIVVESLARTNPSELRAEMLSNRKKREAAMRARDAAGALPDDLVQTVRAFQESRVLLTAIELDVFTAVGAGTGAAEVARKLGTDPRATEMLLNALVAIQMLAKKDGVFHNTPAGRRYLVSGSPDDARLGLMHMVGLWTRWSTLTDCVRAGTSVTFREAEARGADWTQAFIAAMDRHALERAPIVVRAVGTEGVKRMLDVGGGSAAYSIAFARASGSLQAEVLDLAPVCAIAQEHIRKAGLSDRVKTRAGDLRSEGLGTGYDLVFVSAICHMLSPSENLDLVRRCYGAVAQGGRLVIQDFILEPGKTAPRTAALFALNMLVGTVAGSSYGVDEYRDWLTVAGFQNVERVSLPGPTSLMISRRS
jgi:(2Fe-2S) ferredoxin/predicted O-methyltransferase YrrM